MSRSSPPKGITVTPTARVDGFAVQLDPFQLDDVAWQFLRSEFTSGLYLDWPLDQRLDAFLRRHGYRKLRDNGSAYNALLDRVMANIVPALRNGVLPRSSEQAKP